MNSTSHKKGRIVRPLRQSPTAALSHRSGLNSGFRLKPDLLVPESVSDKLVLDNKWKLIDGTRANGTDKYGLAQADFYQLHAYGQSYLDGECDVVLIYPKTDAFSKPLDVFDFRKTTGLRLWVLPFCLRERTLAISKDAPFAANFKCASTVAVQGREFETSKLTESALI